MKITPFLAALAAAAAVSGAVSCSADTPAGGLRELAQAHHLELGAAVRPEYFADANYLNTLKANFNYMTPENDLKWEMIRLSPTSFDFTAADTLADFAKKNHMNLRGHTLVWHNQNPSWLKDLPDDQAVWAKTLQTHITTVMKHFAGTIRDWDVVNEAIDDNGSMRQTLWSQHLGPGYIAQALQWAHEADPKARLFINDYNTEVPGPKSDKLYEVVKELLAQGVPLNGVGFQCHLLGTYEPDYSAVEQNFKRFAALGLEVQITEMDVRMPGTVEAREADRQARIYSGMLQALINAGGKTCIFWGVTDLHSWVPGFFGGFGSALLFDEHYQPKPATEAIRKLLKSLP